MVVAAISRILFIRKDIKRHAIVAQITRSRTARKGKKRRKITNRNDVIE